MAGLPQQVVSKAEAFSADFEALLNNEGRSSKVLKRRVRECIQTGSWDELIRLQRAQTEK